MLVFCKWLLAFCTPYVTQLSTKIQFLHERLTWSNLAATERYNTSWELADLMLERYYYMRNPETHD